MNTSSSYPVPKWFSAVAIVALLWNLMGCAAYLMDVRMSPEDVLKLSAAQQQLYASRTLWAVSATAIAVWMGALGCVGLLLRKAWAFPVLLLSLVGVIVQDFGLFVLTDAAKIAGPVVFVLQGLVLVIAIALVWWARRGVTRAWLR
jgi:hypothetical protein